MATMNIVRPLIRSILINIIIYDVAEIKPLSEKAKEINPLLFFL